jgi:tRNA threonylcarbamoyladenosine biosynthesis protein TsaB
MLILTIRTDKPQAEVGLFEDNNQIAYETWQAHRHLSETIHLKIEQLLKSQQKDWPDIKAIVCFKGPGSFTGLRIGLSVANSLAYGLDIPIVGGAGEDWRIPATDRLLKGENDKIVKPEYGLPVHITQPKK